MNKVLSLLVIVAILSSITAGLYLSGFTFNNLETSNLITFLDEYDLRSFIVTHSGVYSRTEAFPSVLLMEVGAPVFTSAVTGESLKASPSGGLDFSLTNVQVEGIDEADYVKTDGEFIYLVFGDEVDIVKAYPVDKASLVSKVTIPDTNIGGIYIFGDKLIILTEAPLFTILDITVVRTSTQSMPAPAPKPSMPKSSIYVYDISVPENPELIKNVTFTGQLSRSRLMKNVLYVVVNERASSNGEDILPVYYIDDVKYEIDPSEIYYNPSFNDGTFQYLILFALNLEDFNYNYTTVLTGYTSILYMSYENIYVTQRISQYTGFSFSTVIVSGFNAKTRIYKFKVDDLNISPEAVGIVNGSINNQFQLDEYKGFLRVSTHVFGRIGGNGEVERFTSHTNIYILDEDMKVVGSVAGLAESEQLYATRFMGDYAYLVTFRRIDPLFVVDLSDPFSPKVVGELKIPGFSTMLQPLWDNLILGIGYERDNVTMVQHLKLSLFDVSDPQNPKEIDKIILKEEGWFWSSAAYEHHAILKIDKYLLVGIPLEGKVFGYASKNTIKGTFGFLVMNISDGKLNEAGLLTMEREVNATQWRWSPYIRGLYIEDVLYFITVFQINMYQLPTLDYITALPLS